MNINDEMPFWEKFKRDYIMPGIEKIIQDVINEEIAKAQEQTAKKIKECAGMIAVTLARQFDVMHMRNEIVISFRDENAITGQEEVK